MSSDLPQKRLGVIKNHWKWEIYPRWSFTTSIFEPGDLRKSIAIACQRVPQICWKCRKCTQASLRSIMYLSNKKKLKKKYWLSFEKSWFPWGEPCFSPLTGTNFSIETRSNLNMKKQIRSRKSRFPEAQTIFLIADFFKRRVSISSIPTSNFIPIG